MLAAVWIVERYFRSVPPEKVNSIAIWAVVGGVIGARLFHVIDRFPYYAAHPLESIAVWQGGIAVYGAFAGVLLGGLLAAWQMKVPIWPLLDVAAPALLVGQAVGRLGCLSNGDAWGSPCSSPMLLCIRYTNPNDLLPQSLIGVPTHPYPLYEIIGEVALLVLLWALRGRLRTGQPFLIATFGYGLLRFFLTFFRQESIIAFGLQQAQLIGLATAAAAAIIFLWRLVRASRQVEPQIS